ncbi:hypothetical protein OS176_13620 [Xanthomonadaceae bacterium XH05]|nr:hypothetical protein [Xanthomonadaceae bacterium XH05]
MEATPTKNQLKTSNAPCGTKTCRQTNASIHLFIMNKILLSLIAAFLLLVTFWAGRETVAPDSQPEPTTSTASPEGAENILRDEELTSAEGGKIKIPGRYQFSDITHIIVADNDNDLISRYSTEQQSILRAFYRSLGEGPWGSEGVGKYNFNDIFSFHSSEQLAWLVSRGFPLPDEILAAEAMSDHDLRSLADRGNLKAGAFLLHRHAEAEAARRDLRITPNAADAPHIRTAVEISSIEGRLLADASPYAAYTSALLANAQGRADRALAAYQLAALLGDTRANDFMASYLARNPGFSDTSAALSSYHGLMLQVFGQTMSQDFRMVVRRPEFAMFPN